MKLPSLCCALVAIASLFASSIPSQAREIHAVRGPRGAAVVGENGAVVATRRGVAVAHGDHLAAAHRHVTVLPAGSIRVIPANSRVIVYHGYSCYFVGGVYYRAVIHQGVTVYVVVP